MNRAVHFIVGDDALPRVVASLEEVREGVYHDSVRFNSYLRRAQLNGSTLFLHDVRLGFKQLTVLRDVQSFIWAGTTVGKVCSLRSGRHHVGVKRLGHVHSVCGHAN